MNYAEADLTGYSNKDKNLILANPYKTINELLSLGLSGKAAGKLKEIPAAPVPEKPDLKPKRIIRNMQPRISSPKTISNNAKLYNSRTKQTVWMNRQGAEGLAKSNPTVYKLVQ